MRLKKEGKMVVKSKTVSTERELEPVRWERIDRIKTLIKGKQTLISEENVEFVFNLLKGFKYYYSNTTKLDQVDFEKFQIWYSFLENKVVLIKGDDLEKVVYKNLLNKDILFLSIVNLNQSKGSTKLKNSYSLVPGEKNDKEFKLTDEELAKNFARELLKKNVREKLKLVYKQLVLENSTFSDGDNISSDLLRNPNQKLKCLFNTPLSLMKKKEREWMYEFLFFKDKDPLYSSSNYDGNIKVIEYEYWEYLTLFSEEFENYLSDIKQDIINIFDNPDSYISEKTLSKKSKLLELICIWFRKYFFTKKANIFYLKNDKIYCEELFCKNSEYYSNQIAFLKLLKQITQSSFNNDKSNVILGLVEIVETLSGGSFMSSLMSNLKLHSSYFYSQSLKSEYIKFLFGKLLEQVTKDFKKSELEHLVFDFQNKLVIGKLNKYTPFLRDGYNKNLILEELDIFIKRKSLNKLSELNLDINLCYILKNDNNSLTFGHSGVDRAILKAISENIPVKISGDLIIKLDFENILRLLIGEIDCYYQEAADHLKIIKEIKRNNPEKVKVFIGNLNTDLFLKQIEHLKIGIGSGLYTEFDNSYFAIDLIKLIFELIEN
jgi:hypothetical protein